MDPVDGRRRRVLGLSALALLSGGTVPVAAAVGGASSAVPSNEIEANVTNTPLYSSGEPEIAVNPTNPNDLVFVSTYYRYVEIAGQRHPYDPFLPDGSLTGIEHCFVAWSTDGGKVWTPGQWPNGDRPYCGDPMVSVDHAGTFYISMDWMGNDISPLIGPGDNQGVNGDIGAISSIDGGRSWYRYGSKPPDNEPVATGTQVDRPYTRVDSKTGKIYEESGVTSPRSVAVSANHGVTWSAPINYPGNHIAVYDGILGTAAQAGRTCGFGGLVCAPGGSTQLTFYVSTNDGRSFTSYLVTDSHGKPVTGGAGDWMSADPTSPGRFAVMQQDATANSYDVYITANSGKSWTGPAVIAAPTGTKPWMDFGSSGPLGVMWKNPDSGTNSFNTYSVLSFDHGKTFSAPLQVNRAPSPPENSNRGDGGDDLSWILVDNRFAYIGWGQVDSQTNALNAYFAKVPLSDYHS